MTTATTDINDTTARPEPVTEWPEGDLPEQSSGPRTTLLPGVYTFKLPENLAQLWHEIDVADGRQYLSNGQANPTYQHKIKRWQLKMDRNAPLVVVGGPFDGEAMTATFTTNPRPRPASKKDDPKTPWISDVAYLLDIALSDKSRPTDPAVLRATINKYAGKTIRLRTGLTGQCRPDKVRYVQLFVDGQMQNMVDPSGIKGCGSRYYTKDFKNPDAGQTGQDGKPIPAYDTEIVCKCTSEPNETQRADGAVPLAEPNAVVIRAFEQVDAFLPPLA